MFTVGSSNFGHRSLERDLENQLLVVSADAAVDAKIRGEVSALFGCEGNVRISDLAQLTTPERRLSWFWQGVVRVFRRML